MNREAIKIYFEKLLLIHVTLNKTEEDVTYDELDTIWYKTLGQQDRHLIQLILEDQKSTTPELSIKHQLQHILTKLQEKPVMLNIFETKEDYLKLRARWKKFHSEGKHKPKMVEYTYSKPNHKWMFDGGKAYRKESTMTLHYYLVYAAARGTDLDKPFARMNKETVQELLREYTFLQKTPNQLKGLFDKLFEAIDVDSKYHLPIINRIVTYLNTRVVK